MSNVALLMAIRDQLTDAISDLKQGIVPEIIEGEKERRETWSQYRHSIITEYVFPDDSHWVNDKPPTHVKLWRELKGLDVLRNRVIAYIDAARSE